MAALGNATHSIDIPAGPLARGLILLSEATGISVGYPGNLPPIAARAVHGRMTAAAALAKLLKGTGFTAIPIGPAVFRLQRAVVPVAKLRPRPMPIVRSAPGGDEAVQADIVVTGQKRPQILSEVPMSISVVALGDGTDRVAPGSRDLALSVDGLAITNLGPGRNRQFIRGVADSPFIGPSQSTVAVQVDNARVTFDAPDPDLRLIDVDRVEILTGPQGPLYGSGALGGIYHVVTRKPELDEASGATRLLVETVAHGGLGIGGESVLNLPILTDRLAVRAAGYASRSGGWIDNVGRRADGNASTIYGGRLALRWQPDEDWTIDVGGIGQFTNVADSQYVTSSDDTLTRASRIAEPTDNDFRSVAATVDGRIGGLKLVSATSYVNHQIDFTFDASTSAAMLGVAAPAVFRDRRSYTVLNQELRLTPAGLGKWLGGVSFLRATSHSDATVRDGISTVDRVDSLNRDVTEYAVFGEGTVPLARRMEATVGLRLFRTMAENEALERRGGSSRSVGKTVLSPSAALSFAPDRNSILFLRYARSVRPGGLALANENVARRFDPDALGTVDLGVRHEPKGGALSYSASVFHTRWDDVQSDYLLANGLVSTRNAGRGRILGAEASIGWMPVPATHLLGGFTVQDGRLVRDQSGSPIRDRRLPITPDVTARLSVARDFDLHDWRASVTGQGNYIGRSRLTFDPDLDRAMGDYATFSLAASFVRQSTTIGLRIDNLLDAREDSFAFGNPFSIRQTNQYVPLQPRTITLSIGRAY